MLVNLPVYVHVYSIFTETKQTGTLKLVTSRSGLVLHIAHIMIYDAEIIRVKEDSWLIVRFNVKLSTRSGNRGA